MLRIALTVAVQIYLSLWFMKIAEIGNISYENVGKCINAFEVSFHKLVLTSLKKKGRFFRTLYCSVPNMGSSFSPKNEEAVN